MDRARYHFSPHTFTLVYVWATNDSITTQPCSQALPSSPFLAIRKNRRVWYLSSHVRKDTRLSCVMLLFCTNHTSVLHIAHQCLVFTLMCLLTTTRTNQVGEYIYITHNAINNTVPPTYWRMQQSHIMWLVYATHAWTKLLKYDYIWQLSISLLAPLGPKVCKHEYQLPWEKGFVSFGVW